jgi:hypothetical protein
MNQFLQSVNIDDNFWECNRELKYLSPFSKFYESDLSKNKEYSSRVMWAIYLFCDPESRFSRMFTSERRKEIKDNYLKDDKFNWEDKSIEQLINGYEDKMLTKLQNSYNRLIKKLEERDNFISNTKYNEKNAATFDKMFANSAAIYKQLKEIEQQLLEETKIGAIKGGRKESLSEKKVL